MASYKQNMALVQQCPTRENLMALLTAHGIPEDNQDGITDAFVEHFGCHAQLITHGSSTVKRVDKETGVMAAVEIQKDYDYKFRVYPHGAGTTLGTLELYDGGAKALKSVSRFLTDDLQIEEPIKTEPITLDLIATYNKLAAMVPGTQLVSAKLAGYNAEDAYGPYTPRFASTVQALSFLEDLPEEAEEGKALTVIKSIKAQFKNDGKRVEINITPTAAFSFQCHKDHLDITRDLLRALVGHPRIWPNRPYVTAESEAGVS